jgi:4-hydroxy-3-polyprenylbenzoate decarboxylase
MTTVAALAIGLGDNALRRAADVTLKEKRPLILVPRETPFSTLHLENLHKLSVLGAVILPPVPAWYNKPTSIEDMENFIIGKILDVLRLSHNLYQRWKSPFKT